LVFVVFFFFQNFVHLKFILKLLFATR